MKRSHYLTDEEAARTTVTEPAVRVPTVRHSGPVRGGQGRADGDLEQPALRWLHWLWFAAWVVVVAGLIYVTGDFS